MKAKSHKRKLNLLFYVSSVVLLATVSLAVEHTRQLTSGEKAKVTGAILSRDGDLIRVLDKKSGEVVVVNINNDTKVERKQHRVLFFRHADMDVTAMVPGLTIQAEGLGNRAGQLDASKIVFTPDAFAVEVAQEQQVLANKAATQNAQAMADQGVAAAAVARSTGTRRGGSSRRERRSCCRSSDWRCRSCCHAKRACLGAG